MLVGIVVAVAAALRTAFVATAQVQSPLRVDAGQYAQYAANLWQHGVYSLATDVPPAPDSFRSPGYPWFLVLCRALGGESGWQGLAIALQAALSTLTVLCGYRLARRWLGFWPALASAVLGAASPHLVVSSAYVLTECVTTFAVVAALWLLAGPGRLRLVAGALTLGYATLCNETLVFLPVAVAFARWRGERSRALALLALAMLPFALWTLRNQTTELARRGSERAIASISHGSYPGMVYADPRLFGFPYREDPAQPEFGSSWHDLGAVLGERVAAAPWRHAAWYLLEKPVWLWSWPLVQGRDVYVYEVANSPYERHAVMAATHAASRWLHAPIMLLAAFGALFAIARRRTASSWLPAALGLIAVLGTLAYVPVIPEPRYLQPVRPLLFVLAAGAGNALVAAVARRYAPAALRTSTGAPGRTTGSAGAG